MRKTPIYLREIVFDFFPIFIMVKKLRCPYCSGLHTKRRGTRKNRKGIVQLIHCHDCDRRFTAGRAQHKREVVRRHLEDQSSYRTIERRNGYTKDTANKVVQEIAATVKDSHWIAKNLQPQWKGVLCFDGTYLNVRNAFAALERAEGWCEDERFLHKLIALLSIDFHTRDLPHYSLGDNENMIDLVLHFQ